MSKLKELFKTRNEYLAKNDELIWSVFLEELKALFEEYPHITEFATPAYAPYFNDGDACTWSFNSDMSTMRCIAVEPESEFDDEEDEGENYYCNVREFKKVGDEYEYFTPEKYIPLQKYVELVDSVPDSLFEKLCKDGELVFNRSGEFYVEDYSHD